MATESLFETFYFLVTLFSLQLCFCLFGAPLFILGVSFEYLVILFYVCIFQNKVKNTGGLRLVNCLALLRTIRRVAIKGPPKPVSRTIVSWTIDFLQKQTPDLQVGAPQHCPSCAEVGEEENY